MTDIGDTDHEYDGGKGSGDHDTPDSPHKTTAGIGDTEESYGDAALDGDGAGGVEELGDEEELLVRVSFTVPDFQSKRARVRTLVPCMISPVFRAAASWPAP